jgi:PAS domain S-box-containing protein
MVGYPLESMHQLTVLDWEYLYPPERVLEMIHNVDEKGDHFETKHRRKDGSTYGVEISTNAAVFAGQKLIFCICRDITKRKQIEEALRQSEQKLTIMFDSLPEGITVTDIDGKIVQLNSATARMHGYRKQGELIGKSAFVLISKGDHANAADSLKRTLETGLSGILEYKFVRKDGSTFPARLNASLMKDTSGKPTGFIAITTDITEEKRKEEAKQRAEQLAQVSSRLAIVGQMASGIAHEINNPLTGVIGFANLLLRKDIPEAVRKDIEIIRYNAQRVASIVQRLLIFARWQKPQRERVDINAIVSTTVAMRAYEMKANNIEVTMQLAPDLPQTVADGGQMQEVFLNIILNAETEMKLAHNKGNLLIKTERIDNTIRISFKDDGPGIPPENLERIFEPFFTTREVGQGTGLGLSISHGIIAEHDGQIYAQSKPGKGATLIVELPIVSAAQVCEVVEPLADEANNEITGHILIVDDEPVVRELLSEILTDRGHEVETVDNATDALKKLETERYSLILLDIKMPSMSGIEFYGHVKDKAKSLAKRIVFITGDAMGKETWHFLRQTKAPYLTKPFDEEQLDMVIGRISGR